MKRLYKIFDYFRADSEPANFNSAWMNDLAREREAKRIHNSERDERCPRRNCRATVSGKYCQRCGMWALKTPPPLPSLIVYAIEGMAINLTTNGNFWRATWIDGSMPFHATGSTQDAVLQNAQNVIDGQRHPTLANTKISRKFAL